MLSTDPVSEAIAGQLLLDNHESLIVLCVFYCPPVVLLYDLYVRL